MGVRFIAFTFLGLTLAIGGSFLALRKSTSPPTKEDQPALQTEENKPWIEVIRPRVTAYKERTGGESHAVRNGDELETGNMVETDANGLANIHFPDGSLLRLDSATKMVLDQAEFRRQNQEARTKIFLFSGKVWSKVLALVTPASLWEVKTSNAVATVRGTAFGVAATSGAIRIIGSEDTVSVQAVDPKTGEILKQETAVTPDTFVQIKEEDIPLIKEEKLLLVSKKATEQMLADPWVKNAKEEDRKYDQKIEDLRRQGLEGQTLQQELRNSLKERHEEQAPVEKRDNTKKQETPPVREQSTNKPAAPDTADNKGPLPSTAQTQSSSSQRLTLTIRARQKPEQVLEGDRLQFDALLTLSDGSTRVVTDQAQWSVVGSIGAMASPGVFVAKLGREVAELGVSRGVVIAIWKNPENGLPVLGKTPLFSVEANPEADTNTDG